MTRFRIAVWGLGFAQLFALGAQASAPEGTASQRVAFVTRQTYGTVGSSAEFFDSKCHIAATDGGLANPLTFKAFVSTTAADAYCRIQGLTGQRETNCGQESLPTGAGPWVRTDGYPFAPRIDLALAPTGQIFAPAALDEDGLPLDPGSLYWTGTFETGELASGNFDGNCNDWSVNDSDLYANVGTVSSTTRGWVNQSTVQCLAAIRVLCLEPGPALPLPPFSQGGALAFVTSAEGPGKLQLWPERTSGVGVEAGDSICQNLAATAGLAAPGTFVAWLSTNSVDAVDRLSFDGPWVRPDGVLVAESKAQLVDGVLFSSINQTEEGNYLTNYAVWTGTGADGLGTGKDCLDWDSSSAGPTGDFGTPNLTDERWTLVDDAGCQQTNPRLYCFSNYSAVIFVDGFESADTSAWSFIAP